MFVLNVHLMCTFVVNEYLNAIVFKLTLLMLTTAMELDLLNVIQRLNTL